MEERSVCEADFERLPVRWIIEHIEEGNLTSPFGKTSGSWFLERVFRQS